VRLVSVAVRGVFAWPGPGSAAGFFEYQVTVEEGDEGFEAVSGQPSERWVVSVVLQA
jgi:hypothetical protein